MHAISLKGLYFIPITWVALQAQPTPLFVIDQRLDLIQLVNDLTVLPTGANARDMSQFASLQDHLAVRLARAMPSRFRDSPLFSNWILCFGPPPKFKPLIPVPLEVRKWMSDSNEIAFLEAMRNFAKQASPLLEREKARKQAHHKLVDDFNHAITPGLRVVNKLIGFHPSFFVSAVFMDGVPSGGQVTIKLESTNKYQTVLLFHPEMDPEIQEDMRTWAVPNLIRCLADNIYENITLPSVPEDPGRRWLSELQRVNSVDAPTWEMHIRKSLARALTVRVFEALGEIDRSKKMLKESEAQMPWVPRLVSRWKELDHVQNGQIMMQSILPDLMKVFAEEDPVVTTKTRMVGVQTNH